MPRMAREYPYRFTVREKDGTLVEYEARGSFDFEVSGDGYETITPHRPIVYEGLKDAIGKGFIRIVRDEPE